MPLSLSPGLDTYARTVSRASVKPAVAIAAVYVSALEPLGSVPSKVYLITVPAPVVADASAIAVVPGYTGSPTPG